MIRWDDHVLAFDASYLIFHQYFSAIKSIPACDFQDVPRNGADGDGRRARRLAAFDTKLHDTIADKIRHYGVDVRNVCFLMDCPRDHIWRRGVLPEYKATRTKSLDFDADAFRHAREVVLPIFVAEGAQMIGCATAEADDIAAGLARAAVMHCARRVTIVTGDSDFAQLVRGPVHVQDMYGHCVLQKQGVWDPSLALLRKVLSGDKADNISAVKPRLGAKTAVVVSMDPDKLRDLLGDPRALALYTRNQTLIDLSKAPDDVLGAVDALFQR
jgi:5'-3' exonuclease